jgi:ATP-dependent protease ClpP protease subunit
MAHAGSGGVSGSFNETVEQTKVWNEQVKKMGEYIVARTGIDDKTWKKYKNKDWWLNCDQQIEYGFATDKLENLNQILGVNE